ncbi:hypothetical protein Cgig2_021624 [Carnegiea gigantea]|uniref:folate gamma-glutamyl hydrolase n=1 Tax=Carnegiea gigantea TaxID=171969 RepID=A0A9Q1Q5T3_9CARY|nr:hypothetical protein Cgig2_021624 [Carnegiea gigantea]
MPNHMFSAACSNSPSSSTNLLWSFLWIPLLISLSIELPYVNAQSSIIMLPTEPDSEAAFPSSPRCLAPDANLNFRPVIGILSHPGDGASGRLKNGTGVSYIAASYVKFVESAGARVVPLVYTDHPGVLLRVWVKDQNFLGLNICCKQNIWLTALSDSSSGRKLDLVNGVLFTGGSAKSGLYFDVVGLIFKKVLEKNDAGQFFPCYAICLGFELLAMVVSKDNNILERFNASYMASTLQFVEGTSIEGTVFERFPPDLLRKLNTECLVMQNHKYGISPGTLRGNQRLSCFFNILTTSADEDDKVYVSTAQAHHYPITAFQWHPEKNAFEWGYSMIPHSEDAVQVTQNVANFFIRKKTG